MSLRRFDPTNGRAACRPPARTHLPFAARSVAVISLRDRPARLRRGAFRRSPSGSASAATRLSTGSDGERKRPKGRSIEDRSVRLLGFAYSRLRSAHVGVRLFRRGRVLPWAFASLRLTDAAAALLRRGVHVRTGANAPSRSTDRPAPALPARIRSWVSRQTCRPAIRSVSNTNPVRCRCGGDRAFDRSLVCETRRVSRPKPLTSLQRVEATDALPILVRFI